MGCDLASTISYKLDPRLRQHIRVSQYMIVLCNLEMIQYFGVIAFDL